MMFFEQKNPNTVHKLYITKQVCKLDQFFIHNFFILVRI